MGRINDTDRKLAHLAGMSVDAYRRVIAANFPAIIPPDYGSAAVSADKFKPVADTLYARYLGRATGGRAVVSVAVNLETKLGDSTVYLGLARSDAPPFFQPEEMEEVAVQSLPAELGQMTANLNYIPSTGQHLWAFFYFVDGVASDYTGATGEIGTGQMSGRPAVGKAPAPGDVIQLVKLPASSTAAQMPWLLVLTE